MKKTFFVVSCIVLVFVLFSCNKEKITEYEKKIEALNSQISSLQGENSLLQEEIDNLKKEIEAYNSTDQYFYQSGADEFLNKNYEKAIDWMNGLKVKFPTSSLIGYADKIIKDSNSVLDEQKSKYAEDLVAFKALYPEYSNDDNVLRFLRGRFIPKNFPRDDRAWKLAELGVNPFNVSRLLLEDRETGIYVDENGE